MERYDIDNPSKYMTGLLNDKIDIRATKAFENYISVVSSPSMDFENFTIMVNEYMEKPPFNFPNPLIHIGGVKRVSFYYCIHFYMFYLIFCKRCVNCA